MNDITPFFRFFLVSLTIIVFVSLYRVVRGPTVFDRVLGLNGIATKAIILLVATGTAYGRVEMFVDVSTGYALLNLVSLVAVAKYLEGRGNH
jgi:multicomponent Na+:H+ antiporter subunit F